ncbi:MAG: sigma-70 family RNA polymerase sigma factor [bacterium]|nr:sigma-70 family RNA polymerase sigma factor [bacterium]
MSSSPPEPSTREIAVHSQWMRRLARRLVADAAVADDLVEDAWSRFDARRVRERTGYLATVVRSLALSRRRSERRRQRREAACARSEVLPSAGEVAARLEIARRVTEALEELAEPYRTTVMMRFYDDLSSAEIARRAGVPASTVRARLRRGLAKLRAHLDDGSDGRAGWMSALLPFAHPRSSAAATALTSVSLLVTMKLLLGTLIAAGALAAVWTLGTRDGAADASPAPLRGNGQTLADARSVTPRDDLPGARTDAAAAAASPVGPAAPMTRASTVRVSARGVTDAGEPIHGAWLHLRRAPDDRARSASDGLLALEVERERFARLAESGSQAQVAGRVDVRVGAAGRRTRNLRAQFVEGAAVLELGDVTLVHGGVVHGRVVDSGGVGIEGALVAYGVPADTSLDASVHERRGPRDLDPSPRAGIEPALLCTTGLGGAFRLDGVPVGHGTAWARTATSLWAFSAPVGVRAGEEVAGVELVVRDAPDEVITGTVVDPGGEPLPGLRIAFERSEDSQGWINVHTDTSGSFFFVPPDGAAHDARVPAPSWEWEDQRRAAIAAGTHDLVIAFERSEWLFVEARGVDGAPLAGGQVTGLLATGPTDRALRRCESPLDAEGRGRLRRPAVALRVRVEAPGYRAVLLGPFAPEAFPDPLRVSLEPVSALVGTVWLPDGRPAAGARVSLHRGAGDADERHRLSHQVWSGDRDAFVYEVMIDPKAGVTADGEGRYRLPLPGVDVAAEGEVARPAGGLAGIGYAGGSTQVSGGEPRERWYVHASARGLATVTSGPHRFEAQREHEIELRLPPGGAIAGRLILEGGGSPTGWTAYAADGRAQVAEAPVGEDGAFRFDELHAGGWQVRVFEPGRRYSPVGGRVRTDRTVVPDVEVAAGRTVEYEHVAVARAAARLAGRLWVDGAAPGALRVVVRTTTSRASITSYETTLDPDGQFEVKLEPGLATSVVVHGDVGGASLFLSAKVEVGRGDNAWSYDLETARIEGRVDPARVEKATFSGAVYIVERDGITFRTSVELDADGRFGPFAVPAGAGVLRGPQSGFRDPGEAWAELELGAGEQRVLDLR